MKLNETWHLDDFFVGGVSGTDFLSTFEDSKSQQIELIDTIDSIDLTKVGGQTVLSQLVQAMTNYEITMAQLETFAQMSADTNTQDEAAQVALSKVQVLIKPYLAASDRLSKKMATLDNEVWDSLITNDDYLSKVSFNLYERRRDAKRLLSNETESLLSQLKSDGIDAWSQIYDTTSSTIKIKVTLGDGTHEYSVGQAMNRMYADPVAENRTKIFAAWEDAFTKHGPIFADILNHLAGYRLTTQQSHGYNDFLEEPLEYNRMQPSTLEAMWQAVSGGKSDFIAFLNRKKDLLKLDGLGWQDVDAPLVFSDVESKTFTFDEAGEFVIKHFASFSPKLADFAQHALENRWVEAENRSHKRPGGYCTDMPASKESRIFMTFTGSASDVSTLAHELGHAFHSSVLKDEPRWNQNYAMNVAETASTFAETIINNANLATATSKNQRLQLLSTKLENATAMFLNIHARFLFEKSFYKERKDSFVSESRLNELMVEAQKEAFDDSLAEYHPHFWASKLHFFIEDVPFYNFPYTFGYLFSLGIYAEYLKSSEGFEDKYIALLQDTGKMTVEDLAAKHLNVDLTKVDFWQAGVQLAAQDARDFIAESNDLVE